MTDMLTPVSAKSSPEEAKKTVDDLYSRMVAKGEREILNGRFMTELNAGTLPKEALQEFWLNWASFVSEVNNLIQVAYQRHVGFFKQNLDLMGPFADKVADELIHPRPPGHLLVVWEQGEIFDLTRDQMLYHEMLPGCRAMLEFERGILYEGTMLEFWSWLVAEEFIGYWAKSFREGLVAMGYTNEQAPYFHQHEEADLVEHEGGVMGHGELNRTVLTRLLETGASYCRPGFSMDYAARLAYEYLAMFHDDVYDHVVGKKG